MTTLADQDYNLLGMSLDVRAHFNQFDLDGCGGDYVAVQDGVSGTTITNLMREAKQGDTWSGWGNVPSGRVKVVFASNDRNCRPNQYCSCRPGSTWAYAGAALKEFELRRHQSTNWYFPPLRFPGQYFDAETDLHENWNRFYDSQTGRYLQQEPLLLGPGFFRDEAIEGLLPFSYQYARANPLFWVDFGGKQPKESTWCQRNLEQCRRNAEDLVRQSCLCASMGGDFSLTEDPRERGALVGGRCDVKKKDEQGNDLGCVTGFSSNTPTDRATFEILKGMVPCE